MIRRLIDALSAPSDFRADPAGHAGNQSAHAWVVGPVLALIGGLWVAAIVYAAWELWQWRRGGRWLDCAEDWLFVMCGAAAVGAAWHVPEFRLAWEGVTACILIGTFRRAAK
ncbi:hypothetical protein [Pontitalea aquivivens]|uniref:hypothetical protein n=1 Tax=Pontitalea aquivivens TaxID=3388663 RepID=UPI003970AFE1